MLRSVSNSSWLYLVVCGTEVQFQLPAISRDEQMSDKDGQFSSIKCGRRATAVINLTEQVMRSLSPALPDWGPGERHEETLLRRNIYQSTDHPISG